MHPRRLVEPVAEQRLNREIVESLRYLAAIGGAKLIVYSIVSQSELKGTMRHLQLRAPSRLAGKHLGIAPRLHLGRFEQHLANLVGIALVAGHLEG